MFSRRQALLSDFSQVFPRKAISTSSRRLGHYETLSVPHNATKSQIKSSFYKLSKLHHPDVAKDQGAKQKFQAASEAYAVLGDDRKRRTYDRELSVDTRKTRYSESAREGAYPQSSYEGRRRGATHAWERNHPHGTAYHRPPPGFRSHATGSASHSQQRRNPFSSPHVQRATGRQTAFAHRRETDADRIIHVSTFWRAMQVIGLVVTVATFGGGWSASAV